MLRQQTVQNRAFDILNALVFEETLSPTEEQVWHAAHDIIDAGLVGLPGGIPAIPPPAMSLLEWSRALLGMAEVRACARKNWLDKIREADPASFLNALELLWKYCPALYCLVSAEVEVYTNTEIGRFTNFIKNIKAQEPLSRAPTFQFSGDIIDEAPVRHFAGTDLVADSVDIEFRKIIPCQGKPDEAPSPPSDAKTAPKTSLQYSTPTIS